MAVLMMMQMMMGAATVPPASDPAFDPSAFVFTIRVENDGDSFTWPDRLAGGYDATFDWGDGSSDHVTAAPSAHVYAVAGDYDVAVTGACPAPVSTTGSDWQAMLVAVKQLGALVGATVWSYAFNECGPIQISATDAFGAGVLDMRFMFANSAVGVFDASAWDTSSVQRFDSMFAYASNANPDVSAWDTSSATNMSNMFREASTFNGDISGWDVSSVTNFSSMLVDAASFDQDLSGWCVQHEDGNRLAFAEGSALQPQHYPVWGTCP